MPPKSKSTLDDWVLRTQLTPNSVQFENPVIQDPIIPTMAKDAEIVGAKRSHSVCMEESGSSSQKRPHVNVGEGDSSYIESDPGLRKPIYDYDSSYRDMIRREYLNKGPCQPTSHSFPLTTFGNQQRKFQKKWFEEFKSWLEYSVDKDAAFCLYCYLFDGEVREDSFVSEGFRNWKKKDKLREHVGKIGSPHNKVYMMGQNLLNQNQHIDIAFVKQDNQAREDYKDRLESSIKVIRLLLELGIPFRGHDEKDESERQGNFRSILKFLGENNLEVKKLQENAPENLKMIAPMIQKDIVRACAIETLNAILSDMGDACFALLIDESRDISIKEQMVVAIRYVDRRGCVMERVIGFVHVEETTSSTLKNAIDVLLSKHNLSTKRLRGQGYDGASNMRGELNGLKTLILRDNKHAFYIHCFAHQLQLTLVNVAKNFRPIMNFFDVVSQIVTQAGSSCKRKDELRKLQFRKIVNAVQSGVLETGQGLNQEISLRRAGDTCWGSHYYTVLRLIVMFSSVVDLLAIIDEDGETKENRGKAEALRDIMTTYDFIFKLYMMKKILGITNNLSKCLQRKDQDIVNAMQLVKLSKERFQVLRDSGWDDLELEVSKHSFDNNVEVPDMDEKFVAPGRSRRGEEMTNKHHYRAELFYVVIDMQVSELNNRFLELETDLLSCMGSLSPAQSFSAFDKKNLLQLATFYDADFSEIDVMALGDELDTYHHDMVLNTQFSELKGITELSTKMVETGKHLAYPLVYSLLTFVLILPVATATVERAFSAMKIVKTELRNRVGNVWMNDSLITYIEKDVFFCITIQAIAKRFQGLRKRREQLPLDY